MFGHPAYWTSCSRPAIQIRLAVRFHTGCDPFKACVALCDAAYNPSNLYTLFEIFSSLPLPSPGFSAFGQALTAFLDHFSSHGTNSQAV